MDQISQEKISSDQQKDGDLDRCSQNHDHNDAYGFSSTKKSCKAALERNNEIDGKGKDAEFLSDRNLQDLWEEYLKSSKEERTAVSDAFAYRDRDLHVNQCLRVIPDQYKEEIKFAPQEIARENFFPELKYDYATNLGLFMTARKPNFDQL